MIDSLGSTQFRIPASEKILSTNTSILNRKDSNRLITDVLEPRHAIPACTVCNIVETF